MKKIFNYIGLVIILCVLIFVGYVTYNTIFHFENIYSTDFINEGKFLLSDDIFQKISGDKIYIIIMKYGSQGDYSGQIKTDENLYPFSGHVKNTSFNHGGTDSFIAKVELKKVKNFVVSMNQKDTNPYELIVQIPK
jgi:hypothetical protein